MVSAAHKMVPALGEYTASIYRAQTLSVEALADRVEAVAAKAPHPVAFRGLNRRRVDPDEVDLALRRAKTRRLEWTVGPSWAGRRQGPPGEARIGDGSGSQQGIRPGLQDPARPVSSFPAARPGPGRRPGPASSPRATPAVSPGPPAPPSWRCWSELSWVLARSCTLFSTALACGGRLYTGGLHQQERAAVAEEQPAWIRWTTCSAWTWTAIRSRIETSNRSWSLVGCGRKRVQMGEIASSRCVGGLGLTASRAVSTRLNEFSTTHSSTRVLVRYELPSGGPTGFSCRAPWLCKDSRSSNSPERSVSPKTHLPGPGEAEAPRTRPRSYIAP